MKKQTLSLSHILSPAARNDSSENLTPLYKTPIRETLFANLRRKHSAIQKITFNKTSVI